MKTFIIITFFLQVSFTQDTIREIKDPREIHKVGTLVNDGIQLEFDFRNQLFAMLFLHETFPTIHKEKNDSIIVFNDDSYTEIYVNLISAINDNEKWCIIYSIGFSLPNGHPMNWEGSSESISRINKGFNYLILIELDTDLTLTYSKVIDISHNHLKYFKIDYSEARFEIKLGPSSKRNVSKDHFIYFDLKKPCTLYYKVESMFEN